MSAEKDTTVERLQAGAKSYACGGFLQSLEGVYRQQLFTDLYFDRMRRKHEHILYSLHRFNNDWSQTIYYMLLRSMDVGQNRSNYEMIADILPLKVIARSCSVPRDVEALILGASGMLSVFKDEDAYLRSMKETFYFLAHKFQLGTMAVRQWNLSRIPPNRHPILRLSQVAQFISLDRLNINAICNCVTIGDVEYMFRVEANNYWSDALMSQSGGYFAPPQYIGYEKSHLLGINFIVPLQLAYADYTSNDALHDRAIALLESIKAERNRYTNGWLSYGVKVQNALESQALIQLATEFCQKRRCDECPVGRLIARKGGIEKQNSTLKE